MDLIALCHRSKLLFVLARRLFTLENIFHILIGNIGVLLLRSGNTLPMYVFLKYFASLSQFWELLA